MPASDGLARRVVDAGRRCSLTTSVLEEWARRGTPRHAQLLRRCGLPAPKTFDGYDWSAVSWPDGLGREDLLSLSIPERRECSRWGSVFGDDQMAAAVIDRIVHHGRLVQFRASRTACAMP